MPSAKTVGNSMSPIPAANTANILRRLPVGAEAQPHGGVHFRVWAPQVRQVHVVLATDADLSAGEGIELVKEPGGYHSCFVEEARTGMFYRYRLSGGAFPDPASRFQPHGPHGPSQIVDPCSFPWTDDKWPGVVREGQIIYEMHIGTFTAEGTWS